MEFTMIAIKNFRNFKDVNIEISNKNVFFGMNNFGKTNFLHAIRYVLDRNFRKVDFTESDFHKKNISDPIEITIGIDVGNVDDIDCQKLRASIKGALSSTQDVIYIRLIAEYDIEEMSASPVLYWGGRS